MQALPDSIARTLRGFGPFAELPAEALAELWEGARVQRLPRGARLWRSGQPVHEVFLVVRGLVSMHQAGSAQGKIVVDFGGPGDVLGMTEGEIVHQATATVVSAQAHVIAIPAGAIAALAQRDLSFARALARRGLGGLERKLRVAAAGPASARLATALLALAGRYGRVGSMGEIVLPFAPPVAELAAFAGLPRALAARIVERWTVHEHVFLYDEALVIEAPWALEGLAKGERGDEAPRSGAVAVRGERFELALAG